MKVLTALLTATLFLAPAADKPKLVLKAPRVMFMPPTGPYQRGSVPIRVTARLEGEMENPEEYYCLAELWEWGDETESLHEPDCEPYQDGTEIKRNFDASREYRYPGTYTIRLHLKRGRETVISGSTRIQIRG